MVGNTNRIFSVFVGSHCLSGDAIDSRTIPDVCLTNSPPFKSRGSFISDKRKYFVYLQAYCLRHFIRLVKKITRNGVFNHYFQLVQRIALRNNRPIDQLRSGNVTAIFIWLYLK